MSSEEADGGVTTWLARLLLVLTSTSPVLVVYGAVLLDRNKTHEATWAFLIALAAHRLHRHTAPLQAEHVA